ncbi:MAG TPA: hypothetical protein VKV57_06705 [bacterium]|nr:hypothetical protein [bacterium]
MASDVLDAVGGNRDDGDGAEAAGKSRAERKARSMAKELAKSSGGRLTEAQAFVEVFKRDPSLYTQYTNEVHRRR